MNKGLIISISMLALTSCVRTSASIIDAQTVVVSADTMSPIRDPEAAALKEGTEKLKELGFDCYKIVGFNNQITDGFVAQGNSYDSGQASYNGYANNNMYRGTYNSNYSAGSNFSAYSTNKKQVKMVMVGSNIEKDKNCVPISTIIKE